MAVSSQTHRLVLPLNQCQNYQKLFRLASSLYSRDTQSSVRVFFEDNEGRYTQMESDSDLMALKYMLKGPNATFLVEVSKSQKQLEQQAVSEYLTETYQAIAEQQFQREVNKSIDNYLQALYKRVAAREVKQTVTKIQKEEVADYVQSMTRSIAHQMTAAKRLPVRERRNKSVRVSPQKQLFKRKEGHIEAMVSRILESMMPVMVQELSYRIVEELKHQRDSYLDQECNPEDY